MRQPPVAPIPDALLGKLYQTLAEPGLWPEVVRELMAWVGGIQGALQIRQLSPELQASMISAGVEPEYHAKYLKHYFPSLRQVASLMAEGAPDKEIAQALGMTLASARTYAARVLKRLGLHSRRELMLHLRS